MVNPKQLSAEKKGQSATNVAELVSKVIMTNQTKAFLFKMDGCSILRDNDTLG